MKYIEATVKDCDKIYALVQETIKMIYPKYYPGEVVDFFSKLHSTENIRQDIEERAVGMLFDGDSLVGTGTCKENHITRVFVLPANQRKGYGSYIMQQLENKIFENYDKIYLDASLPAARLYEKRGYTTVRHDTWNCENDVVLVYEIMEKPLAKTTFVLSEFDPKTTAVINPKDIVDPVEGMPEVAIACYSNITFDRMISGLDTEIIAATSTANHVIPIYKARYKNTDIALFMIDVGAPASVAILEDVFMMGVKKAIVFGTCGVLDKSIEDCSLIIPNSALRDEGTSYHYVSASDEIEVNRKYMDVFTKMLEELHVKYTVGKTWTTDAVYRETPDKIRRRKEQGCICVDMECSADAAVAKFRGKDLVQFFYAADNLDSEKWDIRSLSNHAKLEEKDRIAMIALELAVRIMN